MMGNLQMGKREKDEGNTKAAEETGKKSGEYESVFMKIPSTLMYLTTQEINSDSLEKLVHILETNDDNQHLTKSVITAKLFCKKSDAKELLEEELRNHESYKSKGIANILMPLLDYNFKDEILKCIQNKQLTEWHVSLAPRISHDFWQECCQAFAKQLLEKGYALQAATYLIAIHHETEAIIMLAEKKYFKEALLMARIYLQKEDPVFHSIHDNWVSYLELLENFAGASLVCVLSGQMNRAYEILSKVRNMEPGVEKALEILKPKETFDGP